MLRRPHRDAVPRCTCARPERPHLERGAAWSVSSGIYGLRSGVVMGPGLDLVAAVRPDQLVIRWTFDFQPQISICRYDRFWQVAQRLARHVMGRRVVVNAIDVNRHPIGPRLVLSA